MSCTDSLHASGFTPNHPDGKEKKSAELSFLLFLWFVSNDQVHRVTANDFGCGTTTVFRIVRRVTEWLLTIMPEHITHSMAKGRRHPQRFYCIC